MIESLTKLRDELLELARDAENRANTMLGIDPMRRRELTGMAQGYRDSASRLDAIIKESED